MTEAAPGRPTSGDGERVAWGWVAHLRDGGTTPWEAWRAQLDVASNGERSGRYLPGAQQLELLRRLNLAGTPDPALVERVVAASAPGRGTSDLELVGAAPPVRWGPRPVDPATLPPAELIRVASLLLAEDVVADAAPAPEPPRFRRVWARPHRLVGDAWLADPLRLELIRRGRPPGGRSAMVYVLGADVATMTVHAFTARAFDEGGQSWEEWLGDPSRRPLPPRADLAAAADWWRERVGRSRIRIALDADQTARAARARRLPRPPAVSADGVDLARRVAAPLGLLVLPAERARLLRSTLLPRLAAHPGPALALPDSHREWARERADRMRRHLRAQDYRVLGDLDQLLPSAADGGSAATVNAPDDQRVLDLAVRLLIERDGSDQHARGTGERADG
ncbi:hypothetical protein [Nocardioides sp. R-C-SC26]|uniref:hypothetical protein n=1 Tax=Nocardioides sp. R-C-SC26 TaxID=2870414 RepID=UPI001E51E2B7|nr:hypothetical protein [Nocardioides sp. R-C-SC26]